LLWKERSMKFNFSLFLVFFVTALLALSGCLFKQGISYKMKNRELILQNDSLISVNIELKRTLQKIQEDSLSKRKRATAWSK
jgi:cell division protein YceG involved in septum cleavage